MEVKHSPKKCYRIASNELPLQSQDGHIQQYLPEELGSGQSEIIQLETDLSYIETCYTPSKEFAVLSKIESQQPRVVVTLGLQGNSRFIDKHNNELLFQEGYTSITCFNSSQGERQYQAKQSLRQLRFSMNKSWLDKYFGEDKTKAWFSKKETQLLSQRPISPQAMMAVQQLSNANVSKELLPLFMRGQAMTLLASELSPLFVKTQKDTARFSQKDKQIVNLARDILLSEFKNPPSIAQLSKRAGTNQCKLKQLFHHFFNNTPYGLLLEYRMNKAYQLLESTGSQVGIVADFVGYAHASNFSAAFIKYFGTSPKQISKQT
ncbi:MAG: helix-turn-helix domain-containing protein [Methylococcaceae bacterium]|nr:helix-turn-helix domain-containing protein [Methylococcaceae bacterium]